MWLQNKVRLIFIHWISFASKLPTSKTHKWTTIIWWLLAKYHNLLTSNFNQVVYFIFKKIFFACIYLSLSLLIPHFLISFFPHFHSVSVFVLCGLLHFSLLIEIYFFLFFVFHIFLIFFVCFSYISLCLCVDTYFIYILFHYDFCNWITGREPSYCHPVTNTSLFHTSHCKAWFHVVNAQFLLRVVLSETEKCASRNS